ncbi:hypothetical protein C4K68_03960 [Pokkaliibacter plantistimulans]|uniref:Uncharacterized protein n=1 Tax=Proteobacteria bacterium 228 TaxID=2083153 RepID=A0A2S5KVY4_9PROT|nr:hypothetical protein C4K68_03960 [Pokkaliibacter plantistimulans]
MAALSTFSQRCMLPAAPCVKVLKHALNRLPHFVRALAYLVTINPSVTFIGLVSVITEKGLHSCPQSRVFAINESQTKKAHRDDGEPICYLPTLRTAQPW